MEAVTATQTDNQLVVLIKGSGLDESKSTQLVADFGGFYELAAEWKEKADALVITDPEQKEEMKQAKEARLMLRDKRIAVEKKHKELKEASLKEGQALDLIKRTLVQLIEPIEDNLKQKEDFAKIWEENQRLKLRQERLAELKKFGIDEEAGYDLGNMSAEVWETFLSGVRSKFEERQELQKQADLNTERVMWLRERGLTPFLNTDPTMPVNYGKMSQEEFDLVVSDASKARSKHEFEQNEQARLEALFNSRKIEISKYQNLLTDAQKTYDYAKIAQDKWDATIAGLEKKYQDDLAEQKRIREENEQLKKRQELQKKRFDELFPYTSFGKEVDMSKLWEQSELGYASILKQKKDAYSAYHAERVKEEIEKAKAEEERRALAKKQEEEKLQMQQQLDRIEEEKRQEQIRQSEEELKARMAPEKEKVVQFATNVRLLVLPTMETANGKQVMAEIEAKRNSFVEWIAQQQNRL